MAFSNRIGSLLKKSVISSSSLFQSIRCMSSSKLFIGGLSYSTDDQSLREAFTTHGEVVEARVIMDRETGRSRGFGFVTFTSEEEASAAITAMDGKDLHGRMVRVNYANDRSRGFGGGGYMGGGGYGGGGYGGGGYGGGGGNYGVGGGGGNYGDNYGSGGGYGGYGGGAAAGGGDINASSGAGGGNFASTGGYRTNGTYGSSSTGSDSYGSGGNGSYGDKKDLFDDFKDDFKDDDYEPDDYANKRS